MCRMVSDTVGSILGLPLPVVKKPLCTFCCAGQPPQAHMRTLPFWIREAWIGKGAAVRGYHGSVCTPPPYLRVMPILQCQDREAV